jgi:dTDP-4-dehydrorhamnose 3,5-epimerase
MRLLAETLPGVKLLALEPHRDERGCYLRCLCRDALARMGVDMAVAQANASFTTRAGTLRGLHYQLPPAEEAKVVVCLKGAIFDVVLDLRPASRDFGRHAGQELSADACRALVVPPRCAHGFLSLTDDVIVAYYVSGPHAPDRERGVRWNDPTFALGWPFPPRLVSERDQGLPDFDPAQHSHL